MRDNLFICLLTVILVSIIYWCLLPLAPKPEVKRKVINYDSIHNHYDSLSEIKINGMMMKVWEAGYYQGRDDGRTGESNYLKDSLMISKIVYK
jgi:hypothetical protein